jgi:hypothetical protein
MPDRWPADQVAGGQLGFSRQHCAVLKAAIAALIAKLPHDDPRCII